MKIKRIVQAKNLAEAYQLLLDNEGALLLAGGVFLKLQKREVPLAIDLGSLELDYFRESEDGFCIGAMTPLHKIERADFLPQALRGATRQIGGVGLRNLVTIGGSVCGRYGFSDVTTALLAVNAQLRFHHAGLVDLGTYLETGRPNKDILIEVIVPQEGVSSFKCIKPVYTDFSLINVAVCLTDKWRIVVGARPGRSVLCEEASLDHLEIAKMLETVKMDDDVRASGAYRRSLAETLIRDCLEEVSK